MIEGIVIFVAFELCDGYAIVELLRVVVRFVVDYDNVFHSPALEENVKVLYILGRLGPSAWY